MNEFADLDKSTVLVTGASGFIGRHLVDYLLQRGCTVHCLVRETSDLRGLDLSRVHLHKADLVGSPPPDSCVEQTDYVFHCAGLTRAKTREAFFRINGEACRPFYQGLAERGNSLKSIVHISSLAAVGPARPGGEVDENTPCNPLTFYGQSKRAGEEIARQFFPALPIVILRPPVVYGPGEKNFFTFLKAMDRGWNVQMGNSAREVSLIYIKDLVRAMVRAATRPPEKENIFFITDGQAHAWTDVVHTVADILKTRPKTIVIPEGGLTLIALGLEFVSMFTAKAPLLDRQRMIDIRQSSWTASPKKFFAQYNFQPHYDLRKGMEETLDWYKKHQWI
ncbi:MAG: NAD-dependent epimerase/dehydratase family protein [Nitrospinaceae bacterium]